MVSIGSVALKASLTPALAVGLALVHLFAGRLGFGGRLPRSGWLSAAGGVSVAYVFVHLLPEVGVAAATLADRGTSTTFVDHHGYLIALFGFVVFYGLEQLARQTAGGADRSGEPDGTGLFWIHVGSFAAYNAIVGFLLWDRELGSLLLFSVAMALHFLVTDDGLRERHGPAYHRRARWLLSAAVIAGFASGYVLEDAELLLAVFVPFLAGGIVLNVIKEELPADRESRFWAFAAGAIGYALLLVFV
jgi:hypothetical protein